MGKKPQRHSWAEAKKLCRLNQDDIAMAKSLGFQPDALVRARPDPKQKWKLPVKYWIHELHFKRFGSVLGEEAEPAPNPGEAETDEDAARRFEEALYWEDYHERNADYRPGEHRTSIASQPSPAVNPAGVPDEYWLADEITDEDVPF